MCDLFAEILGTQSVRVEQDFFASGGSSLLVMRLISRIRGTLGLELRIQDVFESPTPAALAARLSEAEETRSTRPRLRAATRDERPVLAPAQRGLWFLQQLDGFRAAYNVPFAVRLSGSVDDTAVELAVRDVVTRHDALRTLYPGHQEEPAPVVLDPGSLPEPLLAVVAAKSEDVPALLHEESNREFDLARDVPLRAVLFRSGEDDHVLSLVFHHIAFDGWSLEPFWEDLASAYGRRTAGRAADRAPLPFSYADYAAWHYRLLGPEDRPTDLARRQLDFWARTLEGLPEELALPYDHARPQGPRLTAEAITIRWDEETLTRLNTLARRESTSLLMVVQAAVAGFLGRISGGTDIPLGTPVAGRTDESLNDMVGYFVNTVVLRTDLSETPSFRELVRRVRDRGLAAFAHQDVPFDRIVELLAPTRELSRNPLFQTMVTCSGVPRDRSALGDAMVTPKATRLGAAKFDLSFDFVEQRDGKGLECHMVYCAELFQPETAEGIASEFRRLLFDLCTDPERPLDEIGPQDTVGYGEPSSREVPHLLPQALRDLVDNAPDDIALVHKDTRLTYAELGERVDRLADLLVERGIGPELRVGVLLPRSDLQLVALLAVLAAGGVFVPLDPFHPASRNEDILKAAEAVALIDLTDHALPDPSLPDIARITLDAPGTRADLARTPNRVPGPVGQESAPRPDHAAYVIHTSGSTGRPKGVVVEHRHLANLLAEMEELVFAPGARSLGRRRLRVSLTAAMTFDASWQGVAALVSGHELHVVAEEVRMDPDAYAEYLVENDVDLVDSTPTYAAQLFASGLLLNPRGPRVVLLGGEPVDQRLWDALRAADGVRAYNVYGPTETTVNATTCALDTRPVPRLGTALGGTFVYVLDGSLRPVPPFARGEIYLSGAQVARGYLGQPGLTSERFVADPYGPPGSRMYRTGDLGHWDSSGHLVFGGRSDDQVKLRGVRIEPGEIASVLAKHPDVEHASVLLHDSATGIPHLVAYTLVPKERFDAGLLRRHTSQRLPSYLVPTEYVRIDEVPLSPSGKLDRDALPTPRCVRSPTGSPTTPRTPREQTLCQLFAEVLGTERVSPDDDFFALGGHSLLAVRLTNRIRGVTGLDFTVQDLMRGRTVAGLLGLPHGEPGEDPFAAVVPFRRGEGNPLFCVHPVTGLGWSYAGLTRHLPASTPVYGLQASGLDAACTPSTSVEEMADDYLGHLRRIQPQGPYQLLGWSFGGNVAHAMATRLQALGEKVSLLALVDSYPLGRVFSLAGGAGDASELTRMHLSADMAREMGTDRLSRIEAVTNNNLRIGEHFLPKVFRGDTLFFASREDDRPTWLTPGLWKPHVEGAIDVRALPYAHFDLMGADAQSLIARTLTPRLCQGTTRPGENT
nr:non-ribosomal peptide synthetase [Nocardiopsis sp. CNR-923]